MGVDISVFYRYTWQGQPRAMHAHLIGNELTVNEADSITCEHTEMVGIFRWENNTIIGDGLSETRRQAITALLIAASMDTVTNDA